MCLKTCYGMSRNMGLKFDSSNNTEGRIKRKSVSIDKSGKKLGLPVTMQSAETVIGKASAQKHLSTIAKSKTVTPAPESALASLTTAQAVINTAQAKSKPSLKDLCPEDKRRIANLIQELARVSEEKEESAQKLREEQETFENKIQQLEQQNQLIVLERESLQQQYRECQELLGLYQQYLSQQQEKLKSITLLNHSSSHSKIPNSEGAPSRSLCGGGRKMALDGSCLDLPSSGNKVGSVECSHSLSTGPCSATSSSIEQNCKVHDRQNHEYSEGGRTDPRSSRFFNGEPCTCDTLRVHVASESRCSHQCHRMENGIVRGAIHTKLAPPLGSEIWEEKRQCLLLQKKQLEVERERIQARLIQQEEKLLLQNQQLQQSYLHYSKLQQATTTDFEKHLNGTSIFNEGPQSSCVVDQVTHSSEIREGETQTLQGSVRQTLSNVQSQEHATNIEQSAAKLSHEISITKKDMATSPMVPQSFRTSALLSTPKASRLDDS